MKSVAAAALAAIVAFVQAPAPPSPDWPTITHETRPWTRWWWLGSAVDEAGLTTELEALRAAGLGGVEITPIYGARGAESRFVPYLSGRWVRLLEHTLREARRLDLGVDMATGTGWPFGGPWVGEEDACRSLLFKTWIVAGGGRLAEPVVFRQAPLTRAIGGSGALEQVRRARSVPLAALVAHSSTGGFLDLTARVDAAGTLDWAAPPGRWILSGLFLGWHGKLVERAAPGGEGDVIDHFSRDAIRRYLARLDAAFAAADLSGLRGFFNDSYEVDDAAGQADGTTRLLEEFQRRRGYDLRARLPLLLAPGRSDDDRRRRLLADYRQTLSDLLLETFTAEWSAWARARGRIVRNQAHGSPANLLDLYAASDIPETEGTEPSRFKWAASAAHVAGRRLVSAEAATWLGEHFRSTLAEVRADVNRFFVAGVNHIVYHGTAYSPASESWPGWLFYAAVEFNPRNTWWTDFAALNAYVARAQSFLQAGAPDHDVLLYYPFYESIAAWAPDSLAAQDKWRLRHFGLANPPAEGTGFEEAGTTLQRRGFTFDYLSDRQLAGLRTSGGRLTTRGGASYSTVVVPASRFVPLETFETILSLAREGATVLAFKRLPDDVAGLADLDRRRARYRRLRDGIRFGPPDAEGVREARIGRGALLLGGDLERLLARAGVSREPLVDWGLAFARRRRADGAPASRDRREERCYFILNPADRELRGWIPFDDRAPGAVLFDPMSGTRGDARARRSHAGGLELYLALAPGESVLAVTTAAAAGAPFPTPEPAGAPVDVAGPWGVRFVGGGPTLPAARTIDRLASWTDFGGEEARFSGTAVYTARFPRPAGEPHAWRLDLGRVRDSARVRLNGRDLATLIGPSFQVPLDASRLSADNLLEVHVTNLMANRIAAMDRAGVAWRTFYNINFPARLAENRGPDGLFTAAKWEPLASGLLGPVTLTPLVDPSRSGR